MVTFCITLLCMILASCMSSASRLRSSLMAYISLRCFFSRALTDPASRIISWIWCSTWSSRLPRRSLSSESALACSASIFCNSRVSNASARAGRLDRVPCCWRSLSTSPVVRSMSESRIWLRPTMAATSSAMYWGLDEGACATVSGACEKAGTERAPSMQTAAKLRSVGMDLMGYMSGSA